MSFLLDISIIGGGLTGNAMLWQCIQQAQAAADEIPRFLSRIRIRIFERREAFGPGFPHNQNNVLPFHITNMVASGMILTEEFRPVPNVKNPWELSDTGCYKTGSVWINPDTHQVMQRDSDRQIIPSESLYAVGAMTRGQIINASIAQSIVRSVSKVAQHLFEKAIPSSERSGQQ